MSRRAANSLQNAERSLPMSKKTYNSVVEMVREITDDPQVATRLDDRIRRSKVVTKLMAIRASKGLTQAEMAKRIGCSQGRISKFEASEDNDVRLGDFRDYLQALGLDLRLLISPHEWTAADQVKFHAVQIRDCLGRLVDLAKHDKQIQKGVQKFHVEALFSLVKLIAESAQNLPKLAVESPGFLDAEIEADGEGHNVVGGDSRPANVARE